jgi:hypothetical protein
MNSHMRFDFVAHFDILIKELRYGGGWWNNNFYTYVQLAENADVDKLGKAVYGYLKKIYEKTSTRIRLQPVKDIHLRSHYAIDLYGATQDRSQYVYIFTAVGLSCSSLGNPSCLPSLPAWSLLYWSWSCCRSLTL